MSSSRKRCLYDVLGLRRDSSSDEIRSAYKRLAFQRHPDKLVQHGISESEATVAFQELVNAYEVLSDSQKRARYDSLRTQVLSSNRSSSKCSSKCSSNAVPDLFSFFSNSVYYGYSDSGRDFYKVYGDLFEKLHRSEMSFAKKSGLDLPRDAPALGNLGSPYAQVDQYDEMAEPNRKSRRIMADENKKLRKKALREFNRTVRELAEFVKKRDKRVIHMKMQRKEEMDRQKECNEKGERAQNCAEPEWARIEEMEEEDEVKEEAERNKFYCVDCRKKFKSDKQWKKHEQSKKHKEKVTELREMHLRKMIKNMKRQK